MKIFIISLKKEIERRAFVSDQLKNLGLEFEFVDAVWGKDVYEDPSVYDKNKALKIELRNLNPGEVGCSLSHQKAYKKIIDQKLDYACIMEDDASLSSDVPEILRHIEKIIEPNQLIQMERCDVYSKKNMKNLFKDYKLVHPKMIKYGSMCQAAGYVITKEAAQKILDINFPVYVPADSWGQYVGKIDFRGIIPSLTLIKQNVSFGSTTIENHTRTEFTKSTPLSLLIYAFKTRNPLGRCMVKTAKKILRRNEK